MKLKYVLLGIAAVAAVTILSKLKRKNKMKLMLADVSDEGYETAGDILYPHSNSRSRKLRYGPVLPL